MAVRGAGHPTLTTSFPTHQPCGLLSEWNRANNEMNYATMMHAAMVAAMPDFDPHFVIGGWGGGRGGMAAEKGHPGCVEVLLAKGARGSHS